MTAPPVTTEELLSGLNRPLPASDEAEKGIISCLMQRPELMVDCPSPSAFYHTSTRIVYQAMLMLYNDGKPCDFVTLTHSLRAAGALDRVGGVAVISELFAFVPIPAHFQFYRRILMSKFALREAIRAAALTIREAQEHGQQDGADDTSGIFDDATRRLQDAREVSAMEESAELPHTPLKELVIEVLNEAEAQAQTGTRISGISTGIDAIDAIIGGLEPGCLTVVSAESSDGKSCLCRQILEAVAIEGHQAIGYTYEMMPRTEARRVLCSQARVDAGNLKSGMLTRGEQMALAAHTRKISEWNMQIIDVAGRSIEQICRDITRKARKLPHGKKLVALIDYIQLCKTGITAKSREREVAHITATAKQCAKMTGAHILMPSQQNKDGDVRESMAIEQDADNLIQIQKVKPKQQPAWKQQEADEPNNTRRIFFKKVRDGERYRHVMMELVGRHFRFEVIREESEP